MSDLKAAGEFPSVIDSTPKDRKLDIDEVFRKIGLCGRSQIVVQIICMYVQLSVAYQTLIMYYTANNPPWKCTATSTSDYCIRHPNETFAVTDDGYKKRCDLNRTDWIYTTTSSFSVVTEYDLVCGKESIGALITAAFFIGWAVGGVFSGLVADRYGRKITLVLSLLFLIIFSIISAYITKVWEMIVLRTLIGAVTGTVINSSFIYLSEFYVPERRALAGSVFQVCFALSEIWISIGAYYERQWRKLTLYATFPIIIALFASIIPPMSPRWLHSTGRSSRAEKILHKIAKFNKAHLFSINLEPIDNRKEEKVYTYLDLFKSCPIIIFVTMQGFGWFSVGLVYFGMALASSDLGGNLYTNFMLTAAADLPGTFLSFYACNKIGRKKSVVLSLLLCAVVLAGIAMVPSHFVHASLTKIILAMIGKCSINLSFCGFYLWSFELYPTSVRMQGMTICQICSRIGSATAPFIASVLNNVYAPLPFIVMSAVSFLAAICGLVLPETNGRPTREKFEDIINAQHTSVETTDDQQRLLENE